MTGSIATAQRGLPAVVQDAHDAGRLVVGTMAGLMRSEGIALPHAADPVLAVTPDPPRRPVKTAPKRGGTIVGFEGGEHTYLGDSVTLSFDGGDSGPATQYTLHLDNGLGLSYGQVVALGGDFYGLPSQPISTSANPQATFVQAYQTLAVLSAAVAEAPQILQVMQIEIDAVNQAIQDGRQASNAYAQLGDSLSAKWNRITGGGSIASDMLPTGRYLDLAAVNWDHFGSYAVTAYEAGHAVAMRAAIAAKAVTDPGTRRLLLERAYAMNAFADHFLTDLFSAGHMRTPRKQLYDTVTPSAVGSLLARFMHDEDSAFGLQVTNAQGTTWQAYGDKRLLDRVDKQNLGIVEQAVQSSVNEVWSAYQTGQPGPNAALQLIANLQPLLDPNQRVNPSPLFLAQGGTVARRSDVGNRQDYSWTTHWWGWSTYQLLSDLPEFRDDTIPIQHDVDILHVLQINKQLDFVEYGVNPDGTFGQQWAIRVSSGPSAVAWLGVDMRGDGATQVVQLYDNGGHLYCNVYGPQPNGGFGWVSQATNLGEGSKAIAFLTVDSNGDGTTDIVQLWSNGGKLAMSQFSPSGSLYTETWRSTDMGEGTGAVGWLTADLQGDGQTEIVQLYDNGGKLGMIIYAPQPGGGYAETWKNPNLGQGSKAVKFLAEDADGDGTAEIVQLYDNGGKLGMIVYAPQAGGGYAMSWKNPNMGEGSGAIQFLAVNVDGDDTWDIAQLYQSGKSLGMIVYAPQAGGGYAEVWKSTNLGQGTSAVAWLTTDAGPDGNTDIVQLCNNSGKLGIVVYSPNPATGGYALSGSLANIGILWTPLAFFAIGAGPSGPPSD